MPDPASSFIALRHRNFRLLWFGQLVSFSGTMMQTAGLLWHVSLLVAPEHRAIALGAVGLVRVVPVIVFSLLSGVLADTLDRRKMMVVTQSAMALLAFALAWLTFRGLSVVWPVYILAGLSAAASAFDGPARQALLPMLVPREHLANAISLNTMMFQAAAVTGPTFAGVTLAMLGVGWVYLINALSFLFVIVALALMRDVPTHAETDAADRARFTLGAAIDGLRFVFRAPLIRSSMLLDFFATFFSSATALLPIFAQDILHVGAAGYGWLYAAPSVGAAVASVAMVGFVESMERRGAVLLSAVAIYGVATIVFGLSRSFWLTFACLAVSGAGDTIGMVLRGVIRQMETPNYLRGRVTGVGMMFYMGGPQLGELEAGLVANWFGAPFSVVSGGVGCVLAVAWIAATTPPLRTYRREGQAV